MKTMDQTQQTQNEAEKGSEKAMFTVTSPLMGTAFSVDMKEFADAKAAAYAMMPKQKRSNLFDSKMFTFLEAPKTQRD